MKKLLFLVILTTMTLLISQCGEVAPNPLNEVKKFYEAPHQLRKMFVKDEEVTIKEPGRGDVSGGFFLFMGALSGDYKEGSQAQYIVTQVRFAWDIQDNTYVVTTLPLEKIRIKLSKTIETPTASFILYDSIIDKEYDRLKCHSRTCVSDSFGNFIGMLTSWYNPGPVLSKYLAYVIFTVRSEDWPANINLPANQSYSQ